MAKERACKTCHLITTKDICPKCKTHSLSDDFSGIVVVLDPKHSDVAKRSEFSMWLVNMPFVFVKFFINFSENIIIQNMLFHIRAKIVVAQIDHKTKIENSGSFL